MVMRLDRAALEQLQQNGAPPGVVLPKYNPSEITAGIIHFGPSNFARAHLAVYAQKLIEAGHKNCGIIAVSPKLAEGFNDAATNRTIVRKKAMAEQDNLFSVWVKNGKSDQVDIIASITDVMVGPHDVQAVIDRMADPEIKLVTMTITQHGYYYNSKEGNLDFKAADIEAFLKHANDPAKKTDATKATVAYLFLALEARMKAGLPSFGIMSLDNIEENSVVLKRTLLALAGSRSKELAKWIRENTPFYTTSVDRIVPQPTEEIIECVSGFLGLDDTQALATEPYMNLVIEKGHYEDDQKKERPDTPFPFGDVEGVLVVDDVKPYALAKLRMLNGAHMALGVVGRLCGETHADDALKNKDLEAFVDRFIKEVAATLPPVKGIDFDAYRLKTLERMRSPFLHDELVRLARNGADKITARFISPLIDAYAQDLPREHIVMALASWVKYVASANKNAEDVHDTETTFHISDSESYKTQLVPLAMSLNGDVTPILSFEGLFGGLEKNIHFVEEFSRAYRKLSDDGQGLGFSVGSPSITWEPKVI